MRLSGLCEYIKIFGIDIVLELKKIIFADFLKINIFLNKYVLDT